MLSEALIEGLYPHEYRLRVICSSELFSAVETTKANGQPKVPLKSQPNLIKPIFNGFRIEIWETIFKQRIEGFMASKMVWLPGEHDKTIQRPGLIKQVTKLEDQAGYVLNIVHPNTKRFYTKKSIRPNL